MTDDKRRFHRIKFAARCELKHNNRVYTGQLENISLNGALASFKESTLSFIQPGDRCPFAVYLGEEQMPLQFIVEIIHSGFSLGGVRFIVMDAETKARLIALLGLLTTEPDKFRNELKLLEREAE